MRDILWTAKLFWSWLAAALICWSAGSAAFAQADTPFCSPHHRFFPDGKVYRLKDRHFRTCHPIVEADGGRRGILVWNPELLPDLKVRNSHVAVILSDRWTFQQGIESRKQFRKPSEDRVFGETRYLAFESESRGPNDKPGSGTYVYDGALNPGQEELPTHYIACIGEAAFKRPNFSCYIYTEYFGVTVEHLRLINFPGARTTEATMDQFPDMPADLLALARAADVTDRLQDLPDNVEIIE